MHFPILDLTSESQRGLNAAVAGAAVDVDWNRAWRGTRWQAGRSTDVDAEEASAGRFMRDGMMCLEEPASSQGYSQLVIDALVPEVFVEELWCGFRDTCVLRNEAEGRDFRN